MADGALWEFTNHVCRVCFGRVMRRQGPAGGAVYRCSQCEAEAPDRVEAICTCGAAMPNGRLAGLACVLNPKPTLEQPSRVVVKFVGEPAGVHS